MKTTNYTTPKEILKFPDHHVSVSVTINDAGVTAVNGKKIVPAGSIVGGGFLADRKQKAVVANTANALGVLRYDVDVTDGPKAGAVVIHGFVDLNKIPTAPSADAIAALKQITFLK